MQILNWECNVNFTHIILGDHVVLLSKRKLTIYLELFRKVLDPHITAITGNDDDLFEYLFVFQHEGAHPQFAGSVSKNCYFWMKVFPVFA